MNYSLLTAKIAESVNVNMGHGKCGSGESLPCTIIISYKNTICFHSH
jgi:hypothetical protein